MATADNSRDRMEQNTAPRPAAVKGGLHIPGTDFYIDPAAPLPEFSKPHAPAYSAFQAEGNKKFVALLTGKSVVPRFRQLSTVRTFFSPSLQQFHGGGAVLWPEDNIYYYACVFDKPRGKRIMDSPKDDLNLDISYEAAGKPLLTKFIEPAIQLLAELHKHDISHGAINLTNIYARPDFSTTGVLFGEFLSAPHSYEQNVIFEPVGRSLADPLGRGPAKDKHDLYALGACAALLALGKNPFKGAKNGEIIARKIEQGSYGALVGRERMPPGLAEFLRAVLNDDLSARWGLEDALKWMEGSRMTVKPARATAKAARSFQFGEHNYSYLRSLVTAMAKTPNMTAQVLKDKKLLQWLQRHISDKSTIANFERHFGSDKNPGENYDSPSLMVAHATIALDPDAPIRYKGLSVMPDGFGNALAHAVLHGEDNAPYLEILQYQLYNYWFEMQHIHLPDSATLVLEIEKARNFMKQKMVGRGFERGLYMLCKDMHCLSPTVRKFFIRDAAGLLAAFEQMAEDGKLPAIDGFFDRHIIAFLAVHEPQVIEPFLSLISSNNAGRRLTGLMHCFAAIQRKFDGGPAPQLIGWFIRNIRPALERIHDRRLRQKLFEQLQKMQDTQSFDTLLNVIDNPGVINADRKSFFAARTEFTVLQNERMHLQKLLAHRHTLGSDKGRQTAMLVSLGLSSLMILLSVLSYYHII